MKEDITLQVLTLAVLASKGIRVARLAGNRNFDNKIIKAKKMSLKECGMLTAAIVVDAKDALDAGLEVVDFETGDTITTENADKYVVLVDANHRCKAHLELVKEDADYKGEFYLMYSLQKDISITKMLSEMNIATNPWKAPDYAKGAAMMVSEDLPLLTAINELTDLGYSLPATSGWLTFGNKITKEVLAKAMNGTIDEALKQTKGIERGKKLLEAARKSFGDDFLGKRTLSDWIISKYINTGEDKISNFTSDMVSFFNTYLNRAKADKIVKLKGKRGETTREQLIFEELNKLWNVASNG